MAVLDIQRRSQQIGRIRIGQQVKAANGKMRPERLTTFRFTTPSERTAHAVADLYGGTVRPWEKQFEVITDRSEIDVTVPPRDAVISQWYEMWGKTIKRRCDSQHEQLTGGPCLCPHAEDPGDADEAHRCALERARLSKLNPPQGCGLVTRINVMIPDLPGLGVFRLDTGSFNAAGESGDKADLMEIARDRNVFLPASLSIEWRVRSTDAKPYPVPVLQILHTFREVAGGALKAGVAGLAAQLAPGKVPAAIASGVAPEPAPDAVPQDAPEGALPDPDAAATPDAYAQQLAYAAADAATDADLKRIVAAAEAAGVKELMVCTDDERDLWEPLHACITARWKALAPAAPDGGGAGA